MKSKRATNALKDLSKTYKELLLRTRICLAEGEKILTRRLYFQKQDRKKHHLLI